MLFTCTNFLAENKNNLMEYYQNGRATELPPMNVYAENLIGEVKLIYPTNEAPVTVVH